MASVEFDVPDAGGFQKARKNFPARAFGPMPQQGRSQSLALAVRLDREVEEIPMGAGEDLFPAFLDPVEKLKNPAGGPESQRDRCRWHSGPDHPRNGHPGRRGAKPDGDAISIVHEVHRAAVESVPDCGPEQGPKAGRSLLRFGKEVFRRRVIRKGLGECLNRLFP
jgi:hypothetical protein